MSLISEYREFCKKLKKDSWSKASIRRRYYDARRRCENKNHTDYKYYGARGIRMLLTKEQWFPLLRKEIFRLLKTGEYKNARDVLEDTQVDRIDGSKGYERGNVRLLKHYINSFFTTQEARHLRLNPYIDVPVGLFDMILEKNKRAYSTRIKDRTHLSISTLFLNQSREPELPLLYYDADRPPFFLNKKDSYYTFDCECGRTHIIDFKIKAKFTYPCGIMIDLAPANNKVLEQVKLKVIEPKELKRAKQYLENIIRLYDI